MKYTKRVKAAKGRVQPLTPAEVKSIVSAAYRLGYADGWEDSIPGITCPFGTAEENEKETDALLAKLPPT